MTGDVRAEVARVARMAARAGLVEAFGHVSARTADGFAITSVAPMLRASPDDVVVFDLAAGPVEGPVGRAPMETPMHAAVYAARPDVGGICRGHPPWVVAWGVGTDDIPLRHGLGALAGHPVRVNDDVELVTTPAQAERVAITLDASSSVVLRGNGALAVGGGPLEAATRLWYLEERARVAAGAAGGDDAGAEVWSRRLQHSPAELTRAIAWFEARFGDPEDTTAPTTDR